MSLATLLLLPLALLGHGVCTWALAWWQLVAARGELPSMWPALGALVVGGSLAMGWGLEWRRTPLLLALMAVAVWFTGRGHALGWDGVVVHGAPVLLALLVVPTAANVVAARRALGCSRGRAVGGGLGALGAGLAAAGWLAGTWLVSTPGPFQVAALSLALAGLAVTPLRALTGGETSVPQSPPRASLVALTAFVAALAGAWAVVVARHHLTREGVVDLHVHTVPLALLGVGVVLGALVSAGVRRATTLIVMVLAAGPLLIRLPQVEPLAAALLALVPAGMACALCAAAEGGRESARFVTCAVLGGGASLALLVGPGAPLAGDELVRTWGVAVLAGLLGLVGLGTARVTGSLTGLVLGGLAFLGAWEATGRWGAPPPGTAGAEDRTLVERASPDGRWQLVVTEGERRLLHHGRPELQEELGGVLGRRLGRIAAALVPEARRVAVLGLGRGHLVTGIALTTGEPLVCVEPDRQLVDLLEDRLPWPAGLPDAPPEVRLESPRGPGFGLAGVVDAELLVIAPQEPARWGTPWGSLEFLEACRSALARNGVLVSWIPLHTMTWDGFGSCVATFVQAFPTARLVQATPLADRPMVALVGGLEALPDPAAVDSLLGARPFGSGPNGMADLYDLWVADAWTLGQAGFDAPVDRAALPVLELDALGRRAQRGRLAAFNTRQLAELVTPLDISSLTRPPLEAEARRRLGLELGLRAFASRALLVARSEILHLAAEAPGSRHPEAVRERELTLQAALVEAWSRVPGHLGVRTALLEWVEGLGDELRWLDAAALLAPVWAVHEDALLGLAFGSVLLHLDQREQALVVLQAAARLAPRDPEILPPLGTALLLTAQDEAAREVLRRAVLAGQQLEPLQQLVLEVLEEGEGALERAREVLPRLDPTEPVVLALIRILGQAEGS